MKHMVDSLPPYPFGGPVTQHRTWRLWTRKQVFDMARDLTNRHHRLLGKRKLLGSLHNNDKRDAALVFRKQTIYDEKPEVLVRFVFSDWYISAAGRV